MDGTEGASVYATLGSEPYLKNVRIYSEYDGVNPRIVCWGDSLTVSLDNASAYPDILRQLSGCEVINYGVEMDSAAMIAMREGGLRVNVKATVIPADTNLIPVFLRTEDNGHVRFLDNGDGGVNPCSISGIEGELSKLNTSEKIDFLFQKCQDFRDERCQGR